MKILSKLLNKYLHIFNYKLTFSFVNSLIFCSNFIAEPQNKFLIRGEEIKELTRYLRFYYYFYYENSDYSNGTVEEFSSDPDADYLESDECLGIYKIYIFSLFIVLLF